MNEQLIKVLLQCIIDLFIELECASDNQIDPDFCIKTMEIVASGLQKISSTDMKSIKYAINQIKENETNNIRRAFVENFIDNFGLE